VHGTHHAHYRSDPDLQASVLSGGGKASTPAPATPDAGAALKEWRALRTEHIEVKGKLQRCRKDNDRLLHEVKAYRKLLESTNKELEGARHRSSEVDRMHARLVSSEQELTGALRAHREAQVLLQEAAERENALRSALQQMPHIR